MNHDKQPVIDFAAIDAAPSNQKGELLWQAATALRVSVSSPRFHVACNAIMRDGLKAEAVLMDMVKFEAAARQSWVDNALQPWCDRHGLTQKQALSVLFDDSSFNPADKNRDLVTKESLFAWGGQQNDFATYLMDDSAAEIGAGWQGAFNAWHAKAVDSLDASDSTEDPEAAPSA